MCIYWSCLMYWIHVNAENVDYDVGGLVRLVFYIHVNPCGLFNVKSFIYALLERERERKREAREKEVRTKEERFGKWMRDEQEGSCHNSWWNPKLKRGYRRNESDRVGWKKLRPKSAKERFNLPSYHGVRGPAEKVSRHFFKFFCMPPTLKKTVAGSHGAYEWKSRYILTEKDKEGTTSMNIPLIKEIVKNR